MKAVVEPVPAPPPAPMAGQSKPLLPVRGVMSLVNKNEDEVLRLVEDGSIPWAFDVALDPQRGRAKELRILPACVASYLRGQACSLEWGEVLRSLLPHDGPVILSKDITRVLNISGTHTYALARRKLLGPCSTWRTGKGGCARFAAKSFIEFLESRRFP